jgi:hypothetical protein
MPALHRTAFPILLLVPLLACGSTEPDCSRYPFQLSPPPAASTHVACTSTTCGDGLNPPTSGYHCSSTLSCKSYDTEQNRCVWLHNLEHGHAVFLYNCPEGCTDLVNSLDSLRQEASVGGNGVVRSVIAPDSQLPNRVAVLLWRRAWLSDTVNPDAVRCLLQLQDANAPEPGLLCSP